MNIQKQSLNLKVTVDQKAFIQGPFMPEALQEYSRLQIPCE